jgi:SAM-dependent methyltransferase
MHRAPDEPLVFLCNICDRENEATLDQLTREDPTCSKCGSTVRQRSLISVLARELFGHNLRLSQIPRSPHVTGIGMSCSHVYANPLSRRVAYRNTFYHCEPRLDITLGDPSRADSLDFVIASDVFEHVDPPVSNAFENVRKMLKPDGVFLFTVPYAYSGGEAVPTLEHFPGLHRYELQITDGHHHLKNTTKDGEIQFFDDLVFHGGTGSTLELRLFSEWSLLQELESAGFENVTIHGGSDLRHGVYWKDPWSLPIAARRRARQRGHV